MSRCASYVSRSHDVAHDVSRSQYFSYSVDQKLKISETLMAILQVYSTCGITADKKKVMKILKY